MWLSSCGSLISSNLTEALHWWSEKSLKHQPATSTTLMVKNLKAEKLGMITLLDADSLVCVYGILVLNVPEQKKGNQKLFLRYILRQLNSEEVKGRDNGGFWHAKLHYNPRESISKNAKPLSVSNKNLN